MEVIDGAAVPAGGGRPWQPVCVLMPPVADRLGEVARWVGVDALVAQRLLESQPRRPLAQVDGGRISLVVFAVVDSAPATAVHLGGHFFPLTVSTGFFGMNFDWLTARIGSGAAFVLLGVVLPCLLVAATLVGARWLTRD